MDAKRPICKDDSEAHLACADIEPQKRFVVYSGDDRFPISPELAAISVRAMAEVLAA